MFIFDENDVMLAHAGNPDFVGRHSSGVDGPNAYPAGDTLVAVADEDGEWFSYTFPARPWAPFKSSIRGWSSMMG